MPLLKELQDQRNKLITDAAAICRKPEVTKEERAQAEAMLNDSDELESRIALEQRFVKHEADQRSFAAPPRPNPGDGNADTLTMEQRAAKEKSAFEQYIRFGTQGVQPELRSYLKSAAAPMREYRDLGVSTPGTGNVTAGAQFVPVGFDTQLIQAQKAWGELLNEVTVKRTATGAPYRFAYSNDTSNGLVELTELAAITEVDPTLANGTSTTTMVTTGWIKVSIQELEDSAFDIDTFVREIFGMRWYRGCTAKITAGSNAGDVQSIVTGAYNGATTASDTAIAYGDFVAAYGALDPAYMGNAKWSMNSNTRAKVMGLTDTLGRPLFIPATASDAPATILGKPVTINQYLANVPAVKGAGIVPIQFGDFAQGYRFRIVNGDTGNKLGDLSIVRADQLFIGSLEIGLMGFGRIGGNITDGGTHPLLNLTMADV